MSNVFDDFEPAPPNTENGAPTDPLPDDIVPARWCTACNTAVVPVRRGQCPVCGKFTVGNSMRTRDKVSESRVRELANRLVRDYGTPSDEIARSQLEALAKTLARLERVKPGTTEHLRLIHAQQALVDALKDSISPQQRQRRQQRHLERGY
jgi:uncharacterized Zn finger protein (UPF0148 family)